MTPHPFPESNVTFRPPADFDESQCQPIRAFVGEVKNGAVDGAKMVVTAWKPSPDELADLNAGAPVFLSFLGGLPPHMVMTSFKAATTVA